MNARATYDDARLIVELYGMRREERLRKARAWFVGSFRPKTAADLAALCPLGSDESASYRMVVTYWEMVASFLTSGVLNKELFYQSGRELLLVWERLREIVPELREQLSDPHYYGNLEAAAADYIEYLQRRSPGAYEAFLKRVHR
jgi:hypothetical protein